MPLSKVTMTGGIPVLCNRPERTWYKTSVYILMTMAKTGVLLARPEYNKSDFMSDIGTLKNH